MKTMLTRRHVLRGAGVALALPWLESLAPKRAHGQAAPRRQRFVPIFFPLGTADFWKPTAPGVGAAWKLSPILEPLANVKDRVTVLGHVDQTAYGGVVEPSNGPLTASYLTGAKCPTSVTPGTPGSNGISVDQRLAQTLAGVTPLPSLQLGLSTQDSYCDGTPCAYSRSISWKDATTPLYKQVDPQAVFDTIVSANKSGAGTDPATRARLASRKSVLDFVAGNAASLSTRLGRTDRARVDEFLTSVRDLEQRVAGSALECATVPRPSWSATVGNVPADYNRDTHANVMIDLIVMALSCDVTRVVSLMLDDARSSFVYDFLDTRTFTALGSTPTTMKLTSSPLGYANSGDKNDGWATVAWWNVSKLARLCEKLAAIPDDAGATLLDNSVVWFGSGEQAEWRPTDLPVLYVGSGGGLLKVDRYIDFAPSQTLSNVYLTFLREVFGVVDASFGDSTHVVPDILA